MQSHILAMHWWHQSYIKIENSTSWIHTVNDVMSYMIQNESTTCVAYHHLINNQLSMYCITASAYCIFWSNASHFTDHRTQVIHGIQSIPGRTISWTDIYNQFKTNIKIECSNAKSSSPEIYYSMLNPAASIYINILQHVQPLNTFVTPYLLTRVMHFQTNMVNLRPAVQPLWCKHQCCPHSSLGACSRLG